MRIARTRSTLGAAALALLALAACTGEGAGGAPDTRLVVGVQNSGSSASLQVLQASGVLEEVSFDLQIAEFDGANSTVEALNSGAIDASIALNSSAPVLAQANAAVPWEAETAPFAVVGAVAREHDPGIAIVVKDDAGIDAVEDLAGHSVTFAPGTANHYFFARAAEESGVPITDVEVVTMPLSEARAAFLGGSVDALVTAVSNARPLVRENGAQIIADSGDTFTNYQFLAATRAALDDDAKSEALGELLRLIQASEDWQAENLEEVTQIYVDVAAQPEQDAALSAEQGIGHLVPIDDQVYATQQDQADLFFAEGIAQSDVDVRIAFDDRYNELVAQF